MKKRLFILLVLLIVFIILQISNTFPLQHRLLFITNFVVLLFFTAFYLLNEKDFSPFIASYIVFSFMFFIMAPILQLDELFRGNNKRFFNGLIYSNALILKANLLIITFNIIFLSVYFYLNKYYKNIKTITYRKNIPFYILLFFVINIFVFIIKYDYLMTKISLASYSEVTSKMSAILNAKFFFYLPFAPLALGVQYLKKNWNNRKQNFYIIYSIVITLLFIFLLYNNPLTAKRNALGPIYITLIFMFIPKWVNTNFKILFLLLFSLIVLFPLSSLLTHSDKNLSEMSFNEIVSYKNVKERVSGQFTNLNFDAFLMTAATIDYVEREGHSMGRQLLPSGLFFIPRAIWVSKPITTGEMIGEHIQKYHDKSIWFHNLAVPFVAESYIDFGVIGVVIYAILLAFLCLKFVSWLKSNDPLRQLSAFYFSIHLIFLLRGDLTNGYVYYIIPFFSFFVFPKIIMKLLR
ncbi:O-antigen polysaccharide polymerase Wzy [Polaribacter sp. Q13]|uniref:O-antigen polysaccharide polymerase Wzy n=1 Tax=Polaribacter sp. Q13 TaxID=2806551 RepID=UPI00193BB9F2|nr:O-antigen polysaccharide polymerase Wzy [Polaribacter sp. Q13]QVY64751.1 O-antigen polysaccharide polymerase Wzy [Polaribacter sp. Q13]